MEQPPKQETSSGQSTKHPESQSSPEPQPKKIRSARLKDKTQENPSTSGLKSPQASESLSDSTSEPSSKGKQLSVMPVPKPLVETDRKADALRRLKVKPEELEIAPQITPSLRQAKGGLRAVLSAMRMSAEDEVIAAFLQKYDSIPEGDRKTLPWEAVCIAA